MAKREPFEVRLRGLEATRAHVSALCAVIAAARRLHPHRCYAVDVPCDYLGHRELDEALTALDGLEV